MKKLVPFLFLGAVAVAVAALAEDEPPPRLEDLAWLAGSWCAEGPNGTAEEHWLPVHGGVMLGVHRDVRGGRAFFEYLRIVVEDGVPVYYASPAGRPATPFTLVESAERSATFANPGHDFPQRMIYASTGEELTATIEGEVDGETRTSSWRWKKDACSFLVEGSAAGPDR